MGPHVTRGPRQSAGAKLLPLLALAALGHARICAGEPSADDLTRMSLSDLANIEVTSVSKSREPLQRAPASVYVITHDDIMRSGAASIPEALRLAPNLLVTQTSSSAYVISARGFGGNPSAQNFSNKLLILIDGRSVYTPLFSGVYANTLDVMLEDVERIEVISGVGATLWGANAMNGVINIITRPSYLSQGGFVDAGAGNQQQALGARIGERIGGDTTLRAYAFAFHRGAEEQADGSSAHDGWSKGQGGFRSDWSTDSDEVTVQGDFYRGTEHNFDNSDGSLLGSNVVTRYQHHGTRSDLQVQAYVDQNEQFGPAGGTAFVVHTYDLQLQQTLAIADQRIVWGGGERVYTYGITDTASFLFDPPSRALTLGNVFVQDTVALSGRLNLVAGVKAEDDPYSGWMPLPDARLSWSMSDRAALWAAASRAIRSPTPFDEDVVEKLGSLTYLAANPRFRPERVTAYEIGSRSQPSADASLSAAVFYNVYDDLRTIETTPGSALGIPFYWGNSMRGDTYGIDAWGNWQILEWWRLSPGVTWLRSRLAFKAGASQLLGLAQAADDPSSHATLTSSMNFAHRTSFDASLRYVGALPSPAMPHYYDLDARFGWQATSTLEVSLSGANLLHARHTELPIGYGEAITRTVFGEARWRF
jgi:iron complex outermembrane receptor protein